MNIKINRDSVCIGDDIDNHSISVFMDNDASYDKLFNVLKEKRYFPSVSGNNVVWVLTAKHYECIFSYFTKTEKLSMGLSEKCLRKIGGNSFEVYLRYYSSPERWKAKIQKMYHDDGYSMWRDGWVEELKYCDYLMKL